MIEEKVKRKKIKEIKVNENKRKDIFGKKRKKKKIE